MMEPQLQACIMTLPIMKLNTTHIPKLVLLAQLVQPAQLDQLVPLVPVPQVPRVPLVPQVPLEELVLLVHYLRPTCLFHLELSL
jgi:hypothetical protein